MKRTRNSAAPDKLPAQSGDRLQDAIAMFMASPFTCAGYFLASKVGVKYDFRIQLDNIWLTIRSATPDIRVVRSCLLGEFERGLSLSRAQHGLIIDAGGYLGLVSILAAIKFPASKIVCLEPHPDNYRLAQKNCEPWKNIQVLKCALGSDEGERQIRDRGTGEWGFTIVEKPDDLPDSSVVATTQTVSMEYLMKHYGASGVDLLKLDIEGGEYDVLRHASIWIDKVDVIVIELHERIRQGVCAMYESITSARIEVEAIGEKRISVSASAWSRISGDEQGR